MRFLKYILLAVGLISAYSCDKDGLEKVIIGENPTPSVLAEHTEAIIITKENLNTANVDFAWTATDFGYEAAVTYALVGKLKESTGSTSEEIIVPIEVAVFQSTTASIKMSVINEAVLKMDAVANNENTIEFSIQAYLTETSERIGSSNKIDVVITPFKINYLPAIYVAGSNQSAPNWNPPTAPELPLVDGDKGIYKGFTYFHIDNAEFKFLGQKSWGEYEWSGTLAKLVPKGGEGAINIKDITVRGMYFFSVDLPNLSATNAAITRIGIIGDATPTGWDTPDTGLTVDATGYIWTANNIQMITDKEYKVRANDAWGIDYGGVADALVLKGGNIKFTQATGAYTVKLDLSIVPYKITFTQ